MAIGTLNSNLQNLQTFKVNSTQITEQNLFKNTFSIRGHDRKMEWNLDFIYEQYTTNNQKFSFPDFGFFLKYDLTENISASVNGKSVLSLLEWNTYSSIYTQSNGNIITKSTTENNLGFLMFNLLFKL